MPNDAKLGLLVGVGVVVATSFIFFRKDTVAVMPVVHEAKAAALIPAQPASGEAYKPEAQPTGRVTPAQ